MAEMMVCDPDAHMFIYKLFCWSLHEFKLGQRLIILVGSIHNKWICKTYVQKSIENSHRPMSGTTTTTVLGTSFIKGVNASFSLIVIGNYFWLSYILIYCTVAVWCIEDTNTTALLFFGTCDTNVIHSTWRFWSTKQYTSTQVRSERPFAELKQLRNTHRDSLHWTEVTHSFLWCWTRITEDLSMFDYSNEKLRALMHVHAVSETGPGWLRVNPL